jgi:hypothetical protein
MKRFSLSVVAIVVMVVAAWAQAPGAPQFSADMSASGPRDRGMKGKMYMGGGKMRMDMSTGEGKMSMITDPAKKTSYMVMHDQQMYMEMSTDAPMGGMMGRGPRMPDVKAAGDNPCAGSPGVTCKMVGTETVNGRTCDKWEFVSSNKSEAGTMWIDQKTRWPIKSVKADGSIMEFTNFKEGAQDASLFAPPAGYQKFDMGAMRGRQ